MKWEGTNDHDREIFNRLIPRFPPPDLADGLLKIFFTCVHPLFPILHRPTFYRQWREHLHHESLRFACVCFSMFAIASRWCDDPRVVAADMKEDGSPNWHRAGWTYFDAAISVFALHRNFCWF
jgi:hypothetical protein